MKKQTGYELSRNWFDFCFENPEKIKPSHTALYFFAIEHCNRLGWKNKFGFPSQMAMEAIGVKNWRTYNNTLTDLVEFGFIEMIEKSKNQYSSNIISLKSAYVKNTKALDKALQKHSTKQGKSTVSINKPITNKQDNNIESHFFYKIEIENNNDKDFSIQYKMFYDLLCGKTKHHDEEMLSILNFEKQLSYVQFEKLYTKSNSNGTLSKKISQIVLSMANDKKYTKNKTSLYLTINNWLNRDFK